MIHFQNIRDRNNSSAANVEDVNNPFASLANGWDEREQFFGGCQCCCKVAFLFLPTASDAQGTWIIGFCVNLKNDVIH